MKKISLLLFLGLFLLGACKKDKVEEQKEEDKEETPGESTSYFVKYSIDGDSKTIENNVDDYQTGTSLSGATDAVNGFQYVITSASIQLWNASFSALEQYLSIGLGEYQYALSSYSVGGVDELEAILSNGNKTLRFLDATNPVNPGAFINFYEDGEIWLSEYVQQPSNASITITESTAGAYADGSPNRSAKGTFSNIKVQKEGTTKTKVLTSGEFYLLYRPR